MQELYFIDTNQNIYNMSGILIGRIGNGYSISREKSDLIRTEKIGKFIIVRTKEEIEKFNQIIKQQEE